MYFYEKKTFPIEKFNPNKIHIFPSIYIKNITGYKFEIIEYDPVFNKILMLKIEDEIILPEEIP